MKRIDQAFEDLNHEIDRLELLHMTDSASPSMVSRPLKAVKFILEELVNKEKNNNNK